MAYLIEQAGGKATTGTMDCLDLVPEHIHDRSGIWLGSKEDVEDLEACYKNDKTGAKTAPKTDAKPATEKKA